MTTDACGSAPAKARVASLRVLRHPKTQDPLDHALVLRFDAPASFTGEVRGDFSKHAQADKSDGFIH
jgi:tRNA modification GTPase